MPDTRIHRRNCNVCEAACGLALTIEDNRIVKVAGDPDDPLSRGYVCPKSRALLDLLNDPDRLRRPLRRRRDGFEEISWEEALDRTAYNFRRIQKRYGKNAAAVYVGNPNAHVHGNILFAVPLLKALGTKNRFSASSADQYPLMLVCWAMFGHSFLFPVPDVERTDFFLVFGANPAVSGGSILSAPGLARRIPEMREKGSRVVVVDPMRTRTAKLAGEHLFIRPGTDCLFLLSLLNVVFSEGLANPGRLGAFTDGLAALEKLAADFPPEKTAGITGVPAPKARVLARDFAAAPTAVAYGRMGVSTQQFGTLATWLIQCLNVVTGNLDRPGGSLFPLPAVDLVGMMALMGEKGSLGRWKSRVRGLPEFAGEFPVAALAEEILTPGEGKIRALFTIAGNPALSAPNGKKMEQALAGLDFMASMDWYLNETTRHADIILPPTFFFEHEHCPIVSQAYATHEFVRHAQAAVDPPPGTLHGWEILKGLALRLTRNPAERMVLKALTPRRLLDLSIRTGPHGLSLHPLRKGLTLKEVEKHENGLLLGPLESRLPDRLFTKNKRINIAPDLFVADAKKLTERFFGKDAPTPGDLLLIGRRHIRTNNTWIHQSPRMVSGKNRCTAWIHPDDARGRKIKEGDSVIVTSRVGSITVPAEITERVMKGVVSIPHGWGHDRPGIQMTVASSAPGVSVNEITDNEILDTLSGNAVFNGVPITVEKAEKKTA